MSIGERVEESIAGLTTTTLLRRNAERFADHPALTTGIDPGARTLSWSELRSEVAALTGGLAALGLGAGDRMLIMASKRPEHWIADLAATHLGAIPCTVYDTLSTEQIEYLATHSAARVVVLEGAEQLRKWQPSLADLPALRAVVVLEEGAIPAGDPRFVSYRALRSPEQADAFERRVDTVTQDQPACMVYTSGTTGNPKAVVLSHRNVIYESVMLDELIPVAAHPRSVSYLPMAHIAERVLGIYLPLTNAGHVTVCASPDQLLPTLAAVRPHGFFGVPRVWEKMATGLRAQLMNLPQEQAAAVDRAREVALEVFRLRANGKPVPDELASTHAELDAGILRGIRAQLGLDSSARNFSGAAPIPVPVLEFLAGFGLDVMEVWGLSETTGCATVSTAESFTIGAVGEAAPGMEIQPGADGELYVRGPVVFSGYLQDDGTVESAVDADGWFATGDVGMIGEDGVVSITDRKKEIIITTGGKNIAPTEIEAHLRAHPLIGQAVAIGDGRPYVTALLVLDEEIAPTWAAQHGITAGDIAELAEHPDIRAELDRAVRDANEALARVEQVKNHHVIGTAWTPESGELTPKLSLRRRLITERYADTIESLYT